MAGDVDHIDIGPLFGPSGAGRDAADTALWQGLARTGAVVIEGYPDAQHVETRARTGLRIFDLSEDRKRSLSSRLLVPGNPNIYRGFWPRRAEGLLQNEFFDVGPDAPVKGPDLPGMDVFEEATPWPDPEPADGWTAAVKDHYRHLNRVAQTLMRAIGRAAGFDEATLAARFDGAHSTLRFLAYPEGAMSPSVEADGALVSGGRHTDASGLSLLWQAGPGLQAQGRDGVFRDIPVTPNAISVHVGDVMTRMTEGRIPATPHRVLAGDGRARHSVGFFLEPALAAPVTPARADAPHAISDTYGWQLLETFAARDQWRGTIRAPSLPRASDPA